MINFFFRCIFAVLNYIAGLLPINSNLTQIINTLHSVTTLLQGIHFQKLLEGVYFIAGKDFVLLVIGVFLGLCMLKFVFALINLIGQFVP